MRSFSPKFLKNTHASISKPMNNPEISLRVQDREESIKIFTFDVTQGYDGREGLVVTDIELGESGREIYRVSREEISVDAIQCVFNLRRIQ